MKIAIVTMGSRGDVQPYLALGQGLQGAGHQVQVVTFAPFGPFVRQHGLAFAPLACDPDLLLRELTTAGSSALGVLRAVRAFFSPPLVAQIMEDLWRACQDADLIIYHLFGGFAAHHIAERLGVPCVQASFYPFSPTRAFPSMPTSAGPRLGGAYNRLTHAAVESSIHLAFAPMFNHWRRRHGLRPLGGARWPYGTLGGRPVPILHAFSERVVPRPGDWGAHVHACGYWFLDQQEAWQPPAALRDFLDAGAPPVFVGFGSMTGPDFTRLAQLVARALRRAGQRGIIQRGWGGLGGLDGADDILLLDAAPHDWLFPRMAAVVHHGGAGTTAAGLRAGVPAVVVPFFGDQPFWGRRLGDLGVSPATLPYRRLSDGRLAGAIRRAVGDGQIRARAARLGEALRAEDGVGRAVALIAASAR